MCGIATVSIGRSSRGRIPYETLREMCKGLLEELQPRGFDASGIAVINDPGKDSPQSRVFKKPLRPSRLVVRPRFEETLDAIGPQTNFIMLHARAATLGDTKDNFNNHPIITLPVVGIHNGTLYNHEELFRDFSDDFDQEGDVDSEIIFKLYNYHLRLGITPMEALKKTSSLLLGAFTGAAVDLTHPHQMSMFKYDRPLDMLRIPYYDMVVTVSAVRYFDSVKSSLGIKAKDELSHPKDGVGLFMDLNIPGRLVDNIRTFELPINKKAIQKINQSRWLTTGYV